MTARSCTDTLLHPLPKRFHMALTHEQQAIEFITRAKRILVATQEHPTADALAAVVALVAFVKKLKKNVDAVVPGYEAKAHPAFLATHEEIRGVTGAMRAFNLSLDVTKTPFGELLYDVKEGKLDITVVPKSGEWTPQDVVFKHGEDRYDLVIALDCPDMASTGPLFREHADFLHRTTVINIDRDPGNEHWGQLNLVDLTAVATTEMLCGLFDQWNRHVIDEDIATALLAGMIAKTNSFRTSNVTPKTLHVASQLITIGARREEIVHGLWRTRSIPTLKLWGRALERLRQDRALGLVWTSISRQDFLEVGADHTTLNGVVTELLTYSPEAKIIVLAYETDEVAQTGTCVTIHVSPPHSAARIGRVFGATGSRDRVDFCLAPGQSLVDGTRMVVERIQETMKSPVLYS